MTQARFPEYYQKTRNRPHFPRTELAASLVQSDRKVAVDCGCGVGADIQYLASIGYRVYGFDAHSQAVAICQERFAHDSQVSLATSRFETYAYPLASLLIANESLYFADANNFARTWSTMTDCLVSGGVFAGDFLGPDDSWAVAGDMAVNSLSTDQVHALLTDFEVIQCVERNEQGRTQLNKVKNWHTFSVVAIKR